jgi:hypothetical protein
LFARFIAAEAKVRVRQPLPSETLPNSSHRRMILRAREETAKGAEDTEDFLIEAKVGFSRR